MIDDDGADGGGAQRADEEPMVQSEIASFGGRDEAAATILQGGTGVQETEDQGRTGESMEPDGAIGVERRSVADGS